MTSFWVYPYRRVLDGEELYGIMGGNTYAPEYPALGRQLGVAFSRTDADLILAALQAYVAKTT